MLQFTLLFVGTPPILSEAVIVSPTYAYTSLQPKPPHDATFVRKIVGGWLWTLTGQAFESDTTEGVQSAEVCDPPEYVIRM
jgi:hypothetical protein